MAKIKRFMDGGAIPPNQYPFANPNTTPPDTNVKVGSQQEPLDTSLDFTKQYAKGGKVKKYADGGIYTAEMGQPPMDPEVAKPTKRKPKPDPDADIFTAEKIKDGKAPRDLMPEDFKKPVKKASGGKVKCYAKGGVIDGIAQRGKTKCKIC